MKFMIQRDDPYILIRFTEDITKHLALTLERTKGVEHVKYRRYSLSLEYANHVIQQENLMSLLAQTILDYYAPSGIVPEIDILSTQPRKPSTT